MCTYMHKLTRECLLVCYEASFILCVCNCLCLRSSNFFSGSQHLSPVNEQDPKPNVFTKHQSFRIRRGPEAHAKASTRWSFGGMAKAVGTGVTAFGSGVVHGTKAVGSGIASGK